MKMPKSIILAGFALLMAYCPMRGDTVESTSLTEKQVKASEVKFYVKGSNIRVVNAADCNIQIYNVLGSYIMTVHIDSEDSTFSLNQPKGIYLLNVGNVTRKIWLK